VSLDWEDEAERVIGRDEDCAVRLAGNDVSRRHASLRRNGAELVISDLGSRNGVRVNGRLVASAHLGAGDVVRLGGWVGVVTRLAGTFTELAPGLLGGAVLENAIAPLRKAAPSDLPIVLEGETGTGKEVVARALHDFSGRKGPLVAVNCASLPEGLAEAELFGYRRGAFTGADRASPGFFRSADGGTLFLDEVSDLPLSVQAKLLRVLEEREVQPLGETRTVPVDVRVVVASQGSLDEAVHEGRFRADLLARLEGVTVRLPPLRKRREDVPPLFSHFLKEQSQGRAPAVEADFVERLLLHDWPFNVRELVLLVRRLLVLHGGESTLHAHHLPERMGEAGSEPPPRKAAPPAPASAGADAVELPALIAALRTAGGNVARASAILGITRQRAYRLMEGHGVDLEALRKQEGER
jgi:DNA-binding NtrC family response regulator